MCGSLRWREERLLIVTEGVTLSHTAHAELGTTQGVPSLRMRTRRTRKDMEWAHRPHEYDTMTGPLVVMWAQPY